jgi:hypothetical protein
MADSGIELLDKLKAGTVAEIGPDDANPQSNAAIQELLYGHGYKMPLMRVSGYGKYGQATKRAVKHFRARFGLGSGETVTRATLERLVSEPASRPVISRPYLTYVLDVSYRGYAKLVSVVAIVEGAGKFAAIARNPDRAGLSIGIIQWAQKPKRLAEITKRFDATTATKAIVRPLLGFQVGDDTGFNSLITHLESARGGTKANGESTNSTYDLIRDPWKSRFTNVCLNSALQKVQVEAAVAAFQASHTAFPTDLAMLTSEKSVALALDIANQFGDGGLRRLAAKAAPGAINEANLQQRLAREAEDKIRELFPLQPAFARARADRSDFILNDAGLLDTIFTP